MRKNERKKEGRVQEFERENEIEKQKKASTV